MTRSKLGWLSLVVALLLVAPAHADEEQLQQVRQQRSFNRFELDTGTANGLWIEAGAFQTQERNRDRAAGIKDTLDIITPFFRVAYGAKLWEAGLLIPYRVVQFEQEMVGKSTHDFSKHGIDDIRMYGKVIPIRTEWLDLGLGLDVSFPSGDDDRRFDSDTHFDSESDEDVTVAAMVAPRVTDKFGSGRVGFLPFGTAAVRAGSLELRGHGGYRFFDTSSTARESVIYGGGLHWLINDRLSLRGEFVGESVDLPGPDRDDDYVAFQPGVDVVLYKGAFAVLMRPTGSIGMTEVTDDWGVGGSVAVSWNPS